ncbi:hypothetical protein FRC08_017519 [Ceratobasidium sp. 394]|nr:hypothetical protein FRC08_017519 [Ceratobasidium sp. 394]
MSTEDTRFPATNTGSTPLSYQENVQLAVQGSDSEANALGIIKDLESLGGSSGYEAWLKETDNGTKPVQLPPRLQEQIALGPESLVTNSTSKYPVTIALLSVFFYTTLRVTVRDNTLRTGTGSAWGIGVNLVGDTNGILFTNEPGGMYGLLRREPKFTIVAGGPILGGSMVYFYEGDKLVAWIADLHAVGGSTVGINGPFKFR